ncbi:MAG TPA: thiamine pyrophosphate-binding protein [Nitrososphaera sp.]|nr:thiamine pyrophosphate-binding protein [Nitrososphaera sp.]
MASSYNIGDYLIHSLHGRGITHIFGVPGDYILSFYDRLTKSKISVVNTCDEQGAGFAADAYARIRGLGVVCITYGVGALKVINTTAQAYAEKSPVVVISGAPGLKEQVKNPLLHHKVRDFDTQKKIFDQITVASTVLGDPQIAAYEIHRVLSAALRFKRPIYIELPRDVVSTSITGQYRHPFDIKEFEQSDPNALREAITEASSMICEAKRPVIIAGEEIHRFGLQDKLLALIDKTQIPVAATILSKSVISELHPLFIGIYEGAVGQEKARQYVESSDCLIILGATLSDITLGMFTAQLDQKRIIYVSAEKLSVMYHHYDNIDIRDFFDALIDAHIARNDYNTNNSSSSSSSFTTHTNMPLTITSTVPRSTHGKKITVKYVFEYLNSCLTDDMIVLADVGDALFAGADLIIHGNTKFLSPAYYASLGFAVPASIGAQLADRTLRPLVIVGDGAFQMTGMELSTAIRYDLNPIVVVLNNGIYLTEQLMLDGDFNNLQPWQYSDIPQVIGGGRGFHIETEDQFDNAISQALKFRNTFSILDVHLERNDRSPALDRLTKNIAKRFHHPTTS